ncbi:MAG: hypothetical protein SFX72_16890 [Isosphaeraceae bacterium]|nr:hypothetical protein [Isosphaeraceae bacterium]
MAMSRRRVCRDLMGLGAVLSLFPFVGCSGDGPLSSQPKKYEGGGPLPEMKGDEITETSPTKSQGRGKAKKP